jgi:hypothetical protein
MTRDDLPAPDQLGVPSVEVVDRSEEAGQRLTLRHDSAGEVSARLDDAVAGRVGDALAEAVRPRFSGAGWTTRRHHDPALPLTVSGGDGEAVTVSEGRDGRVLLEIETAGVSLGVQLVSASAFATGTVLWAADEYERTRTTTQ